MPAGDDQFVWLPGKGIVSYRRPGTTTTWGEVHKWYYMSLYGSRDRMPLDTVFRASYPGAPATPNRRGRHDESLTRQTRVLPCESGHDGQVITPECPLIPTLRTEKTMKLTDLLQDVREQLPEARGKMYEELIEKYGGSETFQFTLALVAGCNGRERRLIRMLIAEVDLRESDNSPTI